MNFYNEINKSESNNKDKIYLEKLTNNNINNINNN